MTEDDPVRSGERPDADPADGDAALDPRAFDGPDWTRDATIAAGGRVRVRRRKRVSRWRRRMLLGAGVLAVLVVGALAWLLYTGLQARTELQAVRAEVHALRSDIAAGDLGAARSDALSVRAHADKAHDLTTGPLWAGAAAVPYLGDPLDTTRAVTSSVHTIATSALPALIDASHRLSPSTVRRPDGSFDLGAVSAVAPSLRTAAAVMDGAVHAIRSASDATWLGQVNSARDDLLTQLTQLTGSVHSASLAAEVLPPMLGADGPRNYIVTFQNEAELRGLGGLPGAFAILRADRGRLSFVRFESDTAFGGISANINLGHEYDVLWPGGPAALYVNSTESPHFPYAARIWASMWQRKTGQRLDGAITLDPTALSYLLAVTGPATLPDHTVVSAGNVVALTQQQIYRRFAANNVARKKFLLQIARAVGAKLVAGNADPTSLVKAAARAAGEYRLLVWARDPAVESRLAGLPLSGVEPALATPYAGLAMVNTLGSKLDYYLHASFDWRRTGCGQIRDVTATVTLRNAAPSHGLPAYVLGDTGQPGFPKAHGTERLRLYYVASPSAQLDSVTLDGKPLDSLTGFERAHAVYAVNVTIPAGATQTIAFRLQEPAGTGAPTLRMQPMVNPVQVHVADTGCGS